MLRFRIPILLWAVVLLVVCVPAILPVLLIWRLDPVLMWESLLPYALIYLVALAFTLFNFVLDVHPEGLRLYHVNRLVWSDIRSARTRRVLFLPYLVLQRKRGMQWWVPLYFTGPVDLREALRQAVPPEHPIRTALA